MIGLISGVALIALALAGVIAMFRASAAEAGEAGLGILIGLLLVPTAAAGLGGLFLLAISL